VLPLFRALPHALAGALPRALPRVLPRVLAIALAACLLAVLVALSATASFAAPPQTNQDDPANELKIDVTLNKDGLVHVAETITFPRELIGSRSLQRQLLTFLPYSNTQWRKFEYSNFDVHSESAQLTFQVLDETKNIAVRIMPDPNAAASDSASPGVSSQSTSPAPEPNDAGGQDDAPERIEATVSYDIEGSLAALNTPGNIHDEFFWGALAPTGHIFNTVTLTIHAPRTPDTPTCELLTPGSLDLSALEDLSSQANDDSPETEQPTASCKVTERDSATTTTVVRGDNMTTYRGMSVRVNYPAGTFDSSSAIIISDPEPDGSESTDEVDPGLEDDPTLTDSIDHSIAGTNKYTLPIIAGVIAIALAGLAVLLGRKRADRTFSTLAVGDVDDARARTATALTHARTGTITKKLGVTPALHGTVTIPKRFTSDVRWEPPQDLDVAEAGAILTLELRWQEATATIFDLAARGYFTVTSTRAAEPAHPRERDHDTGPLNWRLDRAPSADAINGASTQTLTAYERRLIELLFAGELSASFATLHSHFAPQVLEALSELGHRISELGLVRGSLDHAANGRAHRKQRTPLGRAYAEQVHAYSNALSGEFGLNGLHPTPLSAKTFHTHLAYAIACDRAVQYARAFDEAGIKFELPQWIDVAEVLVPDEPTFGWFVELLVALGQ